MKISDVCEFYFREVTNVFYLTPFRYRSSETDGRTAGQEIRLPVTNKRKVRHRLHKSPPLVPVLNPHETSPQPRIPLIYNPF